MRVLFVPLSAPTHYFHQVTLAWALRAAGHEVRVAGEAPVLDAVARSGMAAVPVGADFDAVATAARGLNLGALPAAEAARRNEERLDDYARAALALAGDLVHVAETWRPHLVVADPLATTAPLAAAAAGAPLVRLLFGPDIVRYKGFPGSGASIDGDVRAAWPARLLDIYDRFGVEVRADFAACNVDPCPEKLQVPGTPRRLGMRYVPYNGPGVVPDWLRDAPARPRICVTWGTVTSKMRGDEGFLPPRILDALAGEDVEVVAAVSAADRHRLGDPPANARVVEQVPLHLLLPTCAGLVHQGGAGALLTAVAFGVPQAIVAQNPDQELNADCLAGTGAGLGLRLTDLAAPAGVRDAVTALAHDPALRAGAAALSADLHDQPTPAEVVGRLEELV